MGPPFMSAMKFGHLEGVPQPDPYGGLLTIVINHLLTGMILQAMVDVTTSVNGSLVKDGPMDLENL